MYFVEMNKQAKLQTSLGIEMLVKGIMVIELIKWRSY